MLYYNFTMSESNVPEDPLTIEPSTPVITGVGKGPIPPLKSRELPANTANNSSVDVNSRNYCKLCNKVVGTRPSCLKTHMLRHTGEKPFTCDYCDKAFFRQALLNAHVRKHQFKPIFCTECGQGFDTNTDLNIHMMTKHKMKYINEGKADEKDDKSSCVQVDDEKSLSEAIVDQMAAETEKDEAENTKNEDDKTPKVEVIEISDEDDDVDTKKKRKRKKLSPKDMKQCEQCPKTFQTGYELKKHLRTHTGERPFMCNQCGKTYTQYGHLSIHMLTHVGTKNFNCAVCEASFYRKADLDRHEMIHLGIKPHQCEICQKSFTQKNNLVMHIKTHIGDRPHECTVCNKKFITRSKLQQHSKRHDKDKKIKMERIPYGIGIRESDDTY